MATTACTATEQKVADAELMGMVFAREFWHGHLDDRLGSKMSQETRDDLFALLEIRIGALVDQLLSFTDQLLGAKMPHQPCT